MDFDAVLVEVREQLEREKRIAYRILKRRFQLNDEDIEDIKADLIDAKELAVDKDGRRIGIRSHVERVATRSRLVLGPDGSLVIDPKIRTPRRTRTQVLTAVPRLRAVLANRDGEQRVLDVDLP